MSELIELNDAVVAALADKLAAQVIARMGRSDEPLWDSAAVGKYLGCGPRQVRERYARIAGFPQPVELPSEEGKRPCLKWFPDEIRQWAKDHRRAA